MTEVRLDLGRATEDASMTDLIDTTEMYLRTISSSKKRTSSRCVRASPSGSATPARPCRRRSAAWSATASSSSRATATRADRGRAAARPSRHAQAPPRRAAARRRDRTGLGLVHEEACRWEHVMSETVERRLVELLEHPPSRRTATRSRASTNWATIPPRRSLDGVVNIVDLVLGAVGPVKRRHPPAGRAGAVRTGAAAAAAVRGRAARCRRRLSRAAGSYVDRAGGRAGRKARARPDLITPSELDDRLFVID